jgi:poly(A) polymerase
MYGHSYEVATFRSDNPYLDGRRPSSVSFSEPEQDALRRDFTVNGLFYDPLANRIIDYVHGKADIQSKLIRTIGNPKERFGEDKLRLMRAIRLACALEFDIVPETWEAIKALSPAILQISWERIRDELLKILTGASPLRGLDLLRESGILARILPEIEPLRLINDQGSEVELYSAARTRLGALHKPSATLALSALLQDVGKASASENSEIAREICRRLKLSNMESDRIADLLDCRPAFLRANELREADLRRLLNKPNVGDHIELLRAEGVSAGRDLKTYHFCLDKLAEYEKKPFPASLLNGEDLIELGYEPGPRFKEILKAIEDLQLEGKIQTREEALQQAKTSFPLTDKTLP